MTAANRFEDRLLEQLRHVVVERPAPDVVTYRKPRRTRLAVAGVGVAAATAVVAIVATSSDVTPRAYAVEPRPDGSVTVAIRSLSDAAGLERGLRAAGVPAVVDYVPAGHPGCAAPPAGATDSVSGGTTAAGGAGPTLHTGGERGTTGAGPSLSGPGPGPGATTSKVTIGSDGASFTIDPGRLEPGEKVYITTSTGAVSSLGMAIAKENPGAACPTPAPAP